jgi:hypothetical protein
MSLINDALKKAARQRAEEQGEIAPMPGGGRRGSRHGGPMQKQTLILIGAAAIVLIVVSVVLTGMFMTGKPTVKQVAVASPTPPPIAPQVAPKVVIEAPVIAVSMPPPTSAPTVVVAKPTATPEPVAVRVPEPAAPAPAAAAAPKVADTSQSHLDEIQAIVDALNISGVRTAGAGSKALVDGHIYKLNDVVDRKVGLRLVKVDEDHLTFTDRDGNTFIRTF